MGCGGIYTDVLILGESSDATIIKLTIEIMKSLYFRLTIMIYELKLVQLTFPLHLYDYNGQYCYLIMS